MIGPADTCQINLYFPPKANEQFSFCFLDLPDPIEYKPSLLGTLSFPISFPLSPPSMTRTDLFLSLSLFERVLCSSCPFVAFCLSSYPLPYPLAPELSSLAFFINLQFFLHLTLPPVGASQRNLAQLPFLAPVLDAALKFGLRQGTLIPWNRERERERERGRERDRERERDMSNQLPGEGEGSVAVDHQGREGMI